MQGHGNMYMHEGGVLAFDPDNEVAMGEAPLEEESSSRSAYDKRRAYSFKFCSLALDTFLQDIPEELPESRPVLDRKVRLRHTSLWLPTACCALRIQECHKGQTLHTWSFMHSI